MSDRGRRAGRGSFNRMDRVNELMREVIAEAVERIADGDERIGFITVSSVECSPDLRHADVLFSSLTDEVAALLDERRIEIQKLLSSQVRMKRTPKLAFKADPTVAAAQRVDDILRRLSTSEGENA